MITVKKAKELLTRNVDVLESRVEGLVDALGCALAEDVFSPVDLPPFTCSAMDGYAVRSSDVRSTKGAKLKIRGEIRAGDSKNITVEKGEAVRVLTGAPVPSGADCVVMQEYTQLEDCFVLVKTGVGKGENIRTKGEEIRRGRKVLDAGTVLNPAVIGFLSIMGFDKVRAIRKPSVSVIVTGTEITKPGTALKPGKVYDSNSFSLCSALKGMGINKIAVKRVGDEFSLIQEVFEKAVSGSDVVVFSGGISVGKYDFVRELFDKVGVETVFYKVKQKPGKPLYFGRYKGKPVFGLPGNPVSSLVCFYEYVYPVVRKMLGLYPVFLDEKTLTLGKEVTDKAGRVNFLRARAYRDTVMPLVPQQSHMLSAFAEANCLLVVPENRKFLRKGEKVKVHSLPL
ncbi:MAG: gephyrin-like molybdotransferase Glp [Thermodesulfobacteriota bacterium]